MAMNTTEVHHSHYRTFKDLVAKAQFLKKSNLIRLNTLFFTLHEQKIERSITLKELVNLVFPEPPQDKEIEKNNKALKDLNYKPISETIPLERILAVLFHCIENTSQFMFTYQTLRETQTLHFRDMEFSTNLKWALEISKTPSQYSIFDAFVKKCSWVMNSKLIEDSSFWSENDLRFIQLLKAFSVAPKEHHSDYVFISTFLLKPLGYVFCDSMAARHLLIQIGFCHPLENFTLLSNQVYIEGIGHRPSDEEFTNMHFQALAWLESHFTQPSVQDALASHRVDMGSMPVYTIDAASATEIDDGISVEVDPDSGQVHWIHVHVADPSSFLHIDHPFMLRAKQRVRTLYFPESSSPMLPLGLSQHLFSLGAFLKKKTPSSTSPHFTATPSSSVSIANPFNFGHAITFSAKLSTKGEILDFLVRPTILRNIIPLTYTEIDLFFNSLHGCSSSTTSELLTPPLIFSNHPHFSKHSTPKDTVVSSHAPSSLTIPVQKDLLRLMDMTEKLLQTRKKNMEFHFNSMKPTVKVTLPSDYTPLFHRSLNQSQFPSSSPLIEVTVDRTATSKSHLLVSECMILAGRVASHYAQEHHLPLPFRGQLPSFSSTSHPHPAVSTTLRVSPSGGGGMLLPSYFSTQAVAHSGLGLSDGYVRVTSPLRRYLDLFSHYQLQRSFLKQPPLWFPDMEQWMSKESYLGKLQTYRELWWVYYLLQGYQRDEEKRRWVYLAKVDAVPEMKLFPVYRVVLTELGVKATLPGGGALKLHLDDCIRVRIKEVDPHTRKLLVEYVDTLHHGPNGESKAL
ncbi:hypothetical protein HMI55_002134 [Coelomomyces lativittatus]|nr:hypothetical protein HMI55_002134 [Coelomomyces lativittatus]